MTLFKQIAIIFSLFIVLIIGSVMYLNFNSANEFIQNQIYSTTEDTATSLGLSLSMNIPKDKSDLSTLQTIINAIFDKGYYQSVTLKDMDGKILIENKNELKVKNVPQWFIKHIHIDVPTAKSQISSGWVPFGVISVKLHSGHAYTELWSIFKDTLNTFAFLSALAMLSLYLLLKIILKSLNKVENQAIAITQNNFIIQKKLPFTTEFKNVVIGMNKMVKKVKYIFDHEALIVKKYNDLLYKDEETGLGNRKFFSLRLSSLIEQKDLKSSGTIVVFVLNNFSKIKETIGFKALNNYIKNIADLLYDITKETEERVISRLKDDEFSIILPDTDYLKTQAIVEKFLAKSQEIMSDDIKNQKDFYIYGGVTFYDETDKQKEILSRADYALSNAKLKNNSCIYFHDMNNKNKMLELGKQEWHKIITNAIKNNGVKLSLQPVRDGNNQTYHEEAYLRIQDEQGVIYPARVFLPLLEKLNLTDEIDKKVIETALKENDRYIAINIATSFIKKLANIRWLEKILKKYKTDKVSFESNNYAITHNLEIFKEFVPILKKYGYSFGIDNFNINSKDLNYLQDLKPSYIKANKSFFFDMSEVSQTSLYESFKILIISLDIKLIATSIETQKESEKLKNINIELMQGDFIQKPSI